MQSQRVRRRIYVVIRQRDNNHVCEPGQRAPSVVRWDRNVPPQPVFLNSTQNNAMYVANYNANSVSAINTTSSFVTNTAPVGVHPVALAETPNGGKLYVANQGDNTVSSLNVASLSSNPVTVPAGTTLTTPVWVVARGDSQKVYVLTQGDATTQVEGQLATIDTATDTVTSSLPVGIGANYIFYDSHLNRLYVTNPSASVGGQMVYVFSDTGGANDTPVLLKQISFAPGSTPCPAGCSPTSVTGLRDGSRFYVASYEAPAGACPDSTVTVPCVIPGLTVFDANSLTPKMTPALTLLTPPAFAVNQYAVPQDPACASPALYAPGTTRFRVFTAAAVDSSHVYVSMCDAGAIADIITTKKKKKRRGRGRPPTTPAALFPTSPLTTSKYKRGGGDPKTKTVFFGERREVKARGGGGLVV